jgi:anti-sigma factor RsiW
MTDADPHAMTGAYALDALDEREAEDFARHLAHCEACTSEVRELQATAARLAGAVAEVPPPELYQRVMAATGEVRRLPPRTTVTPTRPRWRPRGLPYLAAAACLVLARPGTRPTSGAPPPRRRDSRRFG